MKLFSFLLVSALSGVVASAASIDIFVQQPSDSKPSKLARVSFDPSTLQATFDSFTPPENKGEQGDSLVSVGLFVDGGRWTSSLAAVSQLASSPLIIHLDQNSQPFHVDVDGSSSSVTGRQTAKVQVVQLARTVSPQLSAPVEHREEEVPEKSLLQQYGAALPSQTIKNNLGFLSREC